MVILNSAWWVICEQNQCAIGKTGTIRQCSLITGPDKPDSLIKLLNIKIIIRDDQ
jgi:hypothetical protein